MNTLLTTPPRSVELALDALQRRLECLSLKDPKRPEIIRQIRILSDALLWQSEPI